MGFPQSTLYRDEMLGLGHVYDTTSQEVLSEITSVPLEYGQAVTMSKGKLAVAGAADKLYGVVRANEVLKNKFASEGEAEEAGSYLAGEVVPVLVSGTIVVATAGSVKKGQTAVLAADGLFAGTDDAKVAGVGTFVSDGTDLAALHVHL